MFEALHHDEIGRNEKWGAVLKRGTSERFMRRSARTIREQSLKYLMESRTVMRPAIGILPHTGSSAQHEHRQ